LDTVICKLLTRHYLSQKEAKLTIDELTQQFMFVRNLMRYEFVETPRKYSDEAFKQLIAERLSILQSFGELTINKETREINLNHDLLKNINKKSSFSYLYFFTDLLSHLWDTYLLVGIGLQELCSAGHVIKETRLVEEIHKAAKILYEEGILPNLFCCLTDTIRTAVHRMAHLKMAEIKSYSTEQSSSISFIASDYKQIKNLEEATAVFIESQDYSESQMDRIREVIEEAVKNAVVTHLI